MSFFKSRDELKAKQEAKSLPAFVKKVYQQIQSNQTPILMEESLIENF